MGSRNSFIFSCCILLIACGQESFAKTGGISPARQKSPYSVTGDFVHLRKAPDVKSRALVLLKNGTELEILEYDPEKRTQIRGGSGKITGAWAKVKVVGGKVGWVFDPYFGLNLGGKGKGFIAQIYEVKKTGFRGRVLASITEGSLRTTISPGGKLLLSTKDPAGKMKLYSRHGETLGRGIKIKFIKSEEAGICDTPGGCPVFTGKIIPPVTRKKEVMLGVMGPTKGKKPAFRFEDASPAPKIIRILLKDTRLRIKRFPSVRPNSFRFTCGESRCKFKTLRSLDGKRIYVLTTLNAFNISGEKFVPPPPTAFRIDRIKNGKLKNLLFAPHITEGDGVETETFLALTDLDGNGVPELWTFVQGYEWHYFRIYSFEKDRVIRVFSGGGAGV